MSGDTITRKRSFAQVPDALVIDHRLSHIAVRLWVRLDKYAGSDGNAFPSRARLASDLGVSKGTIARGLGELAAAGWISRHPRDDRPGGSWQTVLHEETTVPTADPVSHMGRGGLTGETGASHMCDPEGYPPTDTHLMDGPSQDGGSSVDDPWVTSPMARPAKTKATRKPKTLTKGEVDADYASLVALCRTAGHDDPMSVWWTLRNEHGAVYPSRLMGQLMDDGQWDGFVGRYGIGEYQPNGQAA